MEDNICAFCDSDAIYSCSCTVKYCDKHQLQHDSLLGNHNITRIKLKHRIYNPKTKLQLIDKITKIKNETKSQIHSLLQEISIFISDFNNQQKEYYKESPSFYKSL